MPNLLYFYTNLSNHKEYLSHQKQREHHFRGFHHDVVLFGYTYLKRTIPPVFSVPGSLTGVALAATASVVVHIAKFGERRHGHVQVHVCHYPSFRVTDEPVRKSSPTFNLSF